MKDIGFFIWKKKWFSLCTKHEKYDEHCTACKSGGWENIFVNNLLMYFENRCTYCFKGFLKNIGSIYEPVKKSKHMKRIEVYRCTHCDKITTDYENY